MLNVLTMFYSQMYINEIYDSLKWKSWCFSFGIIYQIRILDSTCFLLRQHGVNLFNLFNNCNIFCRRIRSSKSTPPSHILHFPHLVTSNPHSRENQTNWSEIRVKWVRRPSQCSPCVLPPSHWPRTVPRKTNGSKTYSKVGQTCYCCHSSIQKQKLASKCY